MSIIENIWPSATTLWSKQLDWGHPNITGNCRNLVRNSRLLCVLPGPIIILSTCLHETTPLCLPSTCVRSTDGSAETTDVASLLYYWCFQTSAAARVALIVADFSDVQATLLLLEIQFSFVCATGSNICWCVIRDWEVNTLACAHD